MVATQGVVAPETCGVGGDLFALVMAPAWDKPLALNASGRMGSKANPDQLREAGHTVVPRESQLTASIPGCVDGLVELSSRLGAKTLSEVLEPAVTVAKEGFEVSNEQAAAFAATADVYRANPAVSSFYPGGGPVSPGDLVVREDLASTLEQIGSDGRDGFYLGRAGHDIQRALSDHVVAEDLEQRFADWVEPLRCEINGQTAWTIPPNSAGYLGPATLAVFLALDPPDDPTDPLWWHLLIEAHRSLAWERERTVADPDHTEVQPEELVSPSTIERAATSVSRGSVGTWPTKPARPSGTAFMCVQDDAGLAVSIINSNYRGTGSPFGAENSGFLLHDRAAGFTLTPGHPNELLPGKRPAHTLSPTIWTRGTEPTWVLGTRGGEIQPQLIAQVAARAIVGRQPLEEAIEAPRWSMTEYEAGSGSTVSVEPGSGVADRLRSLGHDVIEKSEMQPGWGPMSIIDCGPSPKAAADPRVDTARALLF